MAQKGGEVMGIDLGTTNSVAAVVVDGEVQIIPGAEGHVLHPSVVAFKPNGQRVVGMPARLRRVMDPRNTIFSAKRLIGQPFRSAAVQAAVAQLPYQVDEGEDQQPILVTRAGRHSVVEIASHLVAHLRDLAQQHLGRPVGRCVVTVPAHFSDGQREATRRAAELAGIEVLRILNEPTAAALAYGMGQRGDRRIVVFDMGGGTFDVTVLEVTGDFFEVRASGGDPFLGGDDMDRALAGRLATGFLTQQRIDLRENPESFALLLIASEQIKARLSFEAEVTGTLNEVAHGVGGIPLSLEFRITRAEFERQIAHLVDRAIAQCDAVLRQAGVAPANLDEVVLVGGATRVPLVERRVAAHLGRKPRSDLDPMEVVARGAALQAALLTGRMPTTSGAARAGGPGAQPADGGGTPLLVDVTPHALGLCTAGGYTDVLIEKNEPIPAERTRLFTTAHDDQRSVVIRVCQGAERVFAANSVLGELRLDDLQGKRRGDVTIEVTFQVDADGILHVAARDPATGRAERATLRVLGLGTMR